MTSVRRRELGRDGNGDPSSYSSCAANIIKLFSKVRAKFTKWSIRSSNSSKVMSSSNKSSSSSSAPPAVLVRSRSSACADPIVNDSHRAQAIEDCIEFLNSSSSHSHSQSQSQSQSQSL